MEKASLVSHSLHVFIPLARSTCEDLIANYLGPLHGGNSVRHPSSTILPPWKCSSSSSLLLLLTVSLSVLLAVPLFLMLSILVLR